MAEPQRPAIFFDRDNTLIVGAEYLGDPAKVELMPGAADCVAGLRRLGYAVVVVSNQSGVARGLYGEADVRAVNDRLDEKLRLENPKATIDLHAFCPHHPDADGEFGIDCDCRKPKPGMLQSAAAELGLNLLESWMVGDAPRDIEAGKAAGCRTILLTVAGIEPSPAASAEQTVRPDYRASSLRDVLEFLKAQAPPRLTTSPSSQSESDLRRQRETPADEFNVLRLLAGAAQVLALAALVWGVAFGDDGPNLTGLLSAIFLQLLVLTLVVASRGE